MCRVVLKVQFISWLPHIIIIWNYSFIGSDHGERVNRRLEPTAIFNLSGEENNAAKDVEPVVFEANCETLYDLFQNLELIQEKLDELKAWYK